jgi:hypothetical protein
MNDEAKVISVEELVKPLAEEMPAPTEPSPDEMPEPVDDFPQVDPNAQTKPAQTDKGGKVFSAELHKVNADGSPRTDKAGFFIPKNKGRKPGGKNQPKQNDLQFEKTEAETQDVKDFQNNTGVEDEFDHAAALYFDVGVGVALTTFSDEWSPENADERKGMIKAIAAYLRAKGDIEITPGQALTFALIAYAGKRVQKPKTKERLTLWYIKIKNFLSKPKLEN